MPYPWANVLLLFLLAIELATGLLGLMSGSSDRAIYLHVHRTGGFAILAIFIWKGRNILRSLVRLRRRRTSRKGSAAIPIGSLALLGVLVLSIALGLTWSQSGPFNFQGFSGLSWHIYVSVLLAPMLLWHSLAHRWTFRPSLWAERRSFLRAGGLALAGLALWQLGEIATGALRLPGAGRRFTGSYEAASFSGNAFPSTSWINDNPSPINAEEWKLRVTGQVDKELNFSYRQIGCCQEQVTATLDCTGGWYSTQEWEGVSLRNILEQAGLRLSAASVTIRSVTGYSRRFSLDETHQLLLATKVGGQTLSHRHGFPLRLAAPGRRGYQWVKWITAIEVNDTGKWLQSPLPLQ